MTEISNDALLRMTANVTSAYLSRHQVQHGDVAALLNGVHGALAAMASGEPQQPAGNTIPAVSIKKSVTDAYLICLEDGKRLKMLKRYLRTHFNLSPEQYRAKWNLPHDYPMVAPDYAKRRSDFAKSIGLGKTMSAGKRGRKKR
jgi:predicted transcriptional regulator